VINPVLFWTIALLTVIPSLSLIFARKAVHIAMSIVLVMVGLAVAYIALDAPFLGMVQIIVYTGAVMMLFLFVLMLVGVDQREELKETIAGQRWIAVFFSSGLAIALAVVVSRVTISLQQAEVGNPEDLAPLLFGKWVLVVEVLAFLLITAAVGALVLTHMPRLKPRRTQKEVADARVKNALNPVNRPMPGVYARHNALDVPALDPDGAPIPDSVSRVLEVRNQTQDGKEFRHQLEGGEG
jgi:NADH-quinone oxidoreductase subunit J